MANWSIYRKISVAAICLLTTCSFNLSAATEPLAGVSGIENPLPWGFFGHQRINRLAIFTLPPEMLGFFKQHIEYLSEHAVDPDKRRYAVEGEAQRHYIDIDHYGPQAFDSVPKHWDDAVAKYTEDTLQAYGIVPWHIQLMKFRLQKAFESKNADLILKTAADLGHYIADAHVPLHTTENYNGHLTNQKGIHGLWESRLVELNFNSYDFFVGKSTYITNLNGFIWDAVKASNQAVDSVLRLEREVSAGFPADQKYTYEQRGKSTVQVYSKAFCDEYNARLGNMVERRMQAAILAVGSIWYTAWVDAGQPDLSSLEQTPPSPELLKELEELEKLYQEKGHGGTTCEE